MRVFKTKWFGRFSRRAGILDADLCAAIARAERGSIDTDLGGGVIKQRIARRNEGKSGGFRTIVLFRSGQRSFFVYGFAKSERDNIAADELRAFKMLAGEMFAYDDATLAKALMSGAIAEVNRDDQEVSE